ncbi:hypothetical protein EJB05_13201 [Eragrostis curvula]|uniref:Uncharacterized protein n=1 Tax=Eragrostis curvula TaxID=38414 RepID=A0A5J9VTG6_9POAL|nr:hypothetical protein EJB05_13201 [Eragrostis curvula]
MASTSAIHPARWPSGYKDLRRTTKARARPDEENLRGKTIDLALSPRVPKVFYLGYTVEYYDFIHACSLFDQVTGHSQQNLQSELQR